ncbi:DUF2203 domain-containing protein [Candidatus Woesearchaeota archaeon]|nr:DUF2203 domain-containing protein [Candidatus Woesearchaeota archaeon]
MRDFLGLEEQKKYFSIDEVEEILPMVEKLIIKLRRLDRTLDMVESIDVETEEEESYSHLRSMTRLNKHFHKMSYDFYRSLEELENMGCIVKDIDNGIVDFYYRFEDRDVFLCWKLGEKEVSHWHEVFAGFQSRQPILDLTKGLKRK